MAGEVDCSMRRRIISIIVPLIAILKPNSALASLHYVSRMNYLGI